MSNNKTIGVISIKGGVGKTTLVTNLGAALAGKFNKKVLVVDANFTAPNLGLHLGVVKPDMTIHDVLHDNVPISESIIKTSHGFDLIAGSLNPSKHQKGRINPYKLHNRLNPLRKNYDVILIDSSPNLNDEMLSTMIASDELLVVATPDFPTLSCTLNAVNSAQQRKIPITGIVLNKIRNKRYELKQSDVEYATNVPVLSTIDDDSRVLESLSRSVPAVLSRPKKDFSVEYNKLAAKLLGEEYVDTRVMTKIKGLKSIFTK